MMISHFEDVMVDIETASLHCTNALILSIGLVEFDASVLDRPTFGERKLIVPNIAEQIRLGRLVEPGTQKFWRDQPLAAALHWTKPSETYDLEDIPGVLEDFFKDRKSVWANGSLFDLGNVQDLYTTITKQSSPPWHYRCPRDMRTFCAETPQTRLIPANMMDGFNLIDHEPISDCIKQIFHVWEHWQR